MKESSEPALLKACLAEFLGTAILALVVGVGAVGSVHFVEYELLFLPLVVGAVVAVLFYLIGTVSGCQLNPAVSLGMFAIRRLTGRQLATYVAAQLTGAWIGLHMASVLIGSLPDVPARASSAAMLGEFVGAFLLVAVVTGVVLDVIDKSIAGIAIGLALMVGITISLAASGGILNPAIALSLGGYHISYLLAPLLGGVAAATVMGWLYGRR